jgi:SAM-dependent methyltransferase
MPLVEPFEQHVGRYEAWFVRHDAAYVSELLALRPFVPISGRGLEIGVGSGRFAAPLGVRFGLDPSPAILTIARSRGIETVQGLAEALPFADDRFDFALVVTTLCFVDSPRQMLAQAWRVLRPGGTLVIGFIDRASPIGRAYEAHRAQNVFYRDARFHAADEVEQLLQCAGFGIDHWAQTLTQPLDDIVDIETVRPGRGVGAFVVVAARSVKPERSAR